VNGDGLDDFIVGAPMINGGTLGRSYVIFGSNLTWNTGIRNVTSLALAQGFVLHGEPASDMSGFSVSSAGDINADGLDDVLVGCKSGSLQPEKLYVVFGSKNISGLVNLGNLSTRGFRLIGDKNDLDGFQVSKAGDINGDEIEDFMIGVPNAAVGNDTKVGRVYILFGSRDEWTNQSGPFNLSGILSRGDRGFMVHGDSPGSAFGTSLSAAGDVNGDGFDDIVIGAVGNETDSGKVYVLFGSGDRWGSLPINVNSLLEDGRKGFALVGVSSERIGFSVSAADINGDGFADVLVGSKTSKVYVVYGSRDREAWGTGIVSLSSLVSARRGILLLATQSGRTDTVVSTAGDVNGDGIDDFMIGSSEASPRGRLNAGQAFVLFGGSSWDNFFDLASLTITKGFILQGEEASDGSGSALSNAGDINGDGLGDLIVASSSADANSGKSYVLLTKNLTNFFRTNNLKLFSDQRVPISLQNLNTTKLGKDFNLTRFLVEKVEQGYFSLLSSPNEIIGSFTNKNILDGQVRFVHTGQAVAPRYRLCVVDEMSFVKVCSDAIVETKRNEEQSII